MDRTAERARDPKRIKGPNAEVMDETVVETMMKIMNGRSGH